MPRKPKPLKPRLPGQRAKPTPRQQKPGPKKPWSRAEEIGHRVAGAIGNMNPFD